MYKFKVRSGDDNDDNDDDNDWYSYFAKNQRDIELYLEVEINKGALGALLLTNK